MAVANTKSTAITAFDSGSGDVMTTSRLDGGVLRESVGVVEVLAADDNNSVYRFVRVPSSVRVTEILIWSDAITSGTDYNVGVWDTADNGGVVVDDNLFADALDLSSAKAGVSILHATLDVANGEKTLWQALGLTADPKKDYDICLIGIAVGSAAGTIKLVVRYID